MIYLLARRACSLAFVMAVTPAYAVGGACQLPTSPQINSWSFDVELASTPPVWSARRTAEEIFKAQTKYLSAKSSPFAKSSIPSELGFYDPNIAYSVQPKINYGQTIGGYQCAQIIGAKLVIKQVPEIYLPRELAAGNCVSRMALAHQLKHHRATTEALQRVVKSPQELKAELFPTYQFQGATGENSAEISGQLSQMENEATSVLRGKMARLVLASRLQNVVTRDNFSQLYDSCQGEFEKASALAGKN